MNLFKKLYIKTKYLARHEKAPRYLAALSFAESSFFPIPPDVMLGPMCIARPKSSYKYAYIAVFFSVLGGIFGYFIGYLAFEAFVEKLIYYFNYQDSYKTALLWFNKWGFWAVVISGFTPIPYKIFTITAGFMKYNLPLFIIGSIIGRSLRFFLVSSLVKFGGKKFDSVIRKYIDIIGWTSLLLLALIILYKIFL